MELSPSLIAQMKGDWISSSLSRAVNLTGIQAFLLQPFNHQRCIWLKLLVPISNLPETNIAPEMDGWNTSFRLGWPIFRGYVSLREGNLQQVVKYFQGSDSLGLFSS